LSGDGYRSVEQRSAALALFPALALAVLLAGIPAALNGLGGESANARPAATRIATTGSTGGTGTSGATGPQLQHFPAIKWRSSRAIGRPNAGRLVRSVRLPNQGQDYFTWDPILKKVPNRGWRRYGTDRLVRTLLTVLSEYRAAHPEAVRVGVADLSRPHGGEFGPRFGGLGHDSHQNGLDVDVHYPRLDRLERGIRMARQIDRPLAQDLVDRFVAAGAQYVFVGWRTGLKGPRRIVQKLAYHDDHMHVRIRRR
jgi:murein endopeptidase